MTAKGARIVEDEENPLIPRNAQQLTPNVAISEEDDIFIPESNFEESVEPVIFEDFKEPNYSRIEEVPTAAGEVSQSGPPLEESADKEEELDLELQAYFQGDLTVEMVRVHSIEVAANVDRVIASTIRVYSHSQNA